MGNNVQRCSRRLVNVEINLHEFLFKKNTNLYDVKLTYRRTPDQVEPGYSYVEVHPATLKELPTTTHVHNVPPKEFDTEYESMYFESPEMADKFMHELRNGYCFKCGHTSRCKEFYHAQHISPNGSYAQHISPNGSYVQHAAPRDLHAQPNHPSQMQPTEREHKKEKPNKLNELPPDIRLK